LKALNNGKKTAKCKRCGTDFLVSKAVPMGDIAQCILCPMCWSVDDEKRQKSNVSRFKKELEEKKINQRQYWFNQYNVEGIFREKSFENFDRILQPRAFDTLKAYNNQSFVLLSPEIYGLGKTHLVCALANHLVKTRESARFESENNHWVLGCKCPVYFTTEMKLLSRIKNTYNNASEETEDQVFSQLARFPLLIIDDIGKVRPKDSSFLQGVHFRIIDERYIHKQQIILTTNLSYKDLENHLGGASSDRLREMCGTDGFIKMTGKSYRHRVSTNPKKEE
jgi:DNA replication protein DnaC